MPLIFGALAPVVPDRVTAGSGLINILTMQGRHRDGTPFSAGYFAAGGFGALSDLDGRPTTPGSSLIWAGPRLRSWSRSLAWRWSAKRSILDSAAASANSGVDRARRSCSGRAATLRSCSRWPTARDFPRRVSRGDAGALREHLINGIPIPPREGPSSAREIGSPCGRRGGLGSASLDVAGEKPCSTTSHGAS